MVEQGFVFRGDGFDVGGEKFADGMGGGGMEGFGWWGGWRLSNHSSLT